MAKREYIEAMLAFKASADKQLISDMYWKDNKTVEEITKGLNLSIHPRSLWRWFKDQGIPLRKPGSRMGVPQPSKSGPNNVSWKGGFSQNRGYIIEVKTNTRVHRAIAERALGRPLNGNEIVHHIDGSRSNNSNDNLLICSREYHSWLHCRMRRMSREKCIAI